MNSFTLLLGSNVNSALNIQKAKDLLNTLVTVEHFSATHESKAVGKKAQMYDTPNYHNLICKGTTTLSLEELNKAVKEIEDKLGRVRNVPENVLIAMDIDIVVWNGKVIRAKDFGEGYFKRCLGEEG